MVKNKIIKRITSISLVLAMSLAFTGCVVGDKKTKKDEDYKVNVGPGDDAYKDAGKDTDTDDFKGAVLTAPDTPPDGKRYDEWKGIEYTTDLEMEVRSYFQPVLSSTEDPLDNDYSYDPDITSKVKIVEAHVEPVGGEMKLRSGGYVDITIKAEWEGTISYTYKDRNAISKFYFQEVNPQPFDMYTGTSFLNHSGDTDESNSMSQGEATDSGSIESDITWKNRVYRIFVSEDEKNNSFGGWDISNNKVTAECSTIAEIKCRVPADYDGLAFKIKKDITDERTKCMDRYGNLISTPDLYADVFTDAWGNKHDQSEFYIIKASDILNQLDGKSQQ